MRWETNGHQHCGQYQDGLMHGEGSYYVPAEEALYSIEFANGKPSGAGTLVEGLGRDKRYYQVEFDGSTALSDGATPSRKVNSRRPEPNEALLPVCGMLAGPKGGPLGYDHCEPVSGELVWARPPRCDCELFNAAECKGKVVVARRGGTDFNRKLLVAQSAGAVGLIVVGWDEKEQKYMRPICSLTEGPVDGDDLPSHFARDLRVEIPVVYMLKKLEAGLCEGAGCFMHFDAKSPPGWRGGAVYIKGTDKKQRNSEGEAQAQWSDADLTFGNGKQSKTMIGSNGQIIQLNNSDLAAPPKQLKCQIATTSTKRRRDCKVLVGGSEFTVYHFKLSFGDVVWEVLKRYSEFDALDEELNTKYGLPPAGLPPKKWFGLFNPDLIRNRHEVLNVYLNDCVKRPVLVLSPELQAFCEMPEEVLSQLKKGG